MNVPLTVVKSGKVDDYVKLTEELNEQEALMYRSIHRCSEIKKTLIELLKEPRNTYLPPSVSQDAEERLTWNKAIKIHELSSQLIEYAGQFQESSLKVDRLEEQIKLLEKTE